MADPKNYVVKVGSSFNDLALPGIGHPVNADDEIELRPSQFRQIHPSVMAMLTVIQAPADDLTQADVDSFVTDAELATAQSADDARLDALESAGSGGFTGVVLGASGSNQYPLFSGTLADLALNETLYDSDGFVTAPGRLTIPTGRGGLYTVYAQVEWGDAARAGLVRHTLGIVIGATANTFAVSSRRYLADSLEESQQFVGSVHVNDGDILRVCLVVAGDGEWVIRNGGGCSAIIQRAAA